ncbi:MAG: S-layer homology domain-containing protein [bacterium]|nr:S-layer homology domain-containing protein [bacterium]
MLKKLLVLFSVSLFAAFLVMTAKAQDADNVFYYLIPPQKSITINGERVTNNLATKGKMLFLNVVPEKVTVDKSTSGVRVISKNYHIDVNKDVQFILTEQFQLTAGSVHVITKDGSTAPETILLGNLSIQFQSADFLLFISGDQSQKILKVLEGDVTIESTQSEQKTILKSQQMTSTDATGKILVPVGFEMSPEQQWWTGKEYQVDFVKLPVANAGEDQRVLGSIAVVLEGSRSTFETGDIFEWSLVKGPTDSQGVQVKEVAFDSTNIVKPLFTPTVEGEYRFSLQITNQQGEKSNVDLVTIYVGKRYLKPIVIFPDVPADHPNNIAISYLYKKNVMTGSDDAATGKRLFRPEEKLNRVEILKTIFVLLGNEDIPTEEELQALGDDIFLDVKSNHWFAPYVYLGKKTGLITGHPDGSYRPADPVNLVEALKIITKAYKLSLEPYKGVGRPYPDAEGDAWYSLLLFFAKTYNLVDMDSLGNIHPDQDLTRGMFAEIIYRLDNVNFLEKRGYLMGTVRNASTKAVINAAEVFIYEALDSGATNGSEGDGFVKKGDLKLKTKTKQDGSFTVSLPTRTKYYIEVISNDKVSEKKIVTEVTEDKATVIELEIKQ